MITSPEITETSAQIAAVVHLRIPRDQIQEVMEPAIMEVLSVISEQGQAPQGPLFAHHLQQSPDSFDFEVGFPVSKPIQPTGRVKPSEMPATTVARTTYHGPYEGLPAAWVEFRKHLDGDAVIREKGLEAGDTLWEIYAVGPETSSDPKNWRTELYLPVRRSRG